MKKKMKFDNKEFKGPVGAIGPKGIGIVNLVDTSNMMLSEYKEDNFRAEYYQTKIRYEKLKKINTKLEAQKMAGCDIDMKLVNNCPYELLRKQQSVMGEYLHILELRSVIQGISIEELVK